MVLAVRLGAMPLVEMLQDINNVFNARVGKHLTAVDATDIGNLIGKTVVAGNVRRSAEMSLGVLLMMMRLSP